MITRLFLGVSLLSLVIFTSLARGEDTVSEAQKELEQLKKDSYLADTIRENELLKMTLKKVKAELDELTALKGKLSELEKEKNLAEEKFAKEKAVSTELAQVIVEERKKQYTLQKTVESIGRERDLAQDKLAELSREKSLSDEKIAQFQKLLDEAKSVQASIKKDLEALSLEKGKLQSQLEAMVSSTTLKLKEKDEQISKLEAVVKEKEKAFQETESLSQLLEKDLKNAKITVSELQSSLEKEKTEKKALQDNLKATEEEFAQSEQKTASLLEKINELEKANEVKKIELEKARSALDRVLNVFKEVETSK